MRLAIVGGSPWRRQAGRGLEEDRIGEPNIDGAIQFAGNDDDATCPTPSACRLFARRRGAHAGGVHDRSSQGSEPYWLRAKALQGGEADAALPRASSAEKVFVSAHHERWSGFELSTIGAAVLWRAWRGVPSALGGTLNTLCGMQGPWGPC